MPLPTQFAPSYQCFQIYCSFRGQSYNYDYLQSSLWEINSLQILVQFSWKWALLYIQHLYWIKSGIHYSLIPDPQQDLLCWGSGNQTRDLREVEEDFFPSKHYETLDTFSVVLFVICMSNSEMSTRMCQPGCVNQDVSTRMCQPGCVQGWIDRWERGWFPAKVISHWHMGVVYCNAYSVWFLWSGLVTQLPNCYWCC